MRRTLSLRREVLRELSDADLNVVAGGTVPQTWYSCLDFLSCNVLQCATRDVQVVTYTLSLEPQCP